MIGKEKIGSITEMLLIGRTCGLMSENARMQLNLDSTAVEIVKTTARELSQRAYNELARVGSLADVEIVLRGSAFARSYIFVVLSASKPAIFVPAGPDGSENENDRLYQPLVAALWMENVKRGTKYVRNRIVGVRHLPSQIKDQLVRI